MRALSVGGGSSLRVPELVLTARKTAELFLFGVLPTLVFCWWLAFAVLESRDGSVVYWAFDTRQFWQAGNDVINGVSPYPSAASLATAGDHLDAAGLLEVFRFSYPAGAAVAFAPLGLLGFDASAAVWGITLVVSLFAALWILGIRDWRVFGVVIGSAPVIDAVRIGTLTPVLLLLLAVAWRWRDRRWAVSGALGTAIALKLFLWPLVVWLAATRRWLEAVLTACLASGATLVAWAVIGFDGLSDYPELVRRLADIVEVRGFSLVALGVEAGLPERVAGALPFLIGLSLLAGVVAVGRRDDGDRVAFSIAVIASIALTPIVWQHYFALLVVPLALARSRLAWAWGLMWIFWLFPAQENEGDLWKIAAAVAVTAAVAAIAVRARRPAAIPGSRLEVFRPRVGS